jgi:3-hydroxybutyryl-CoA dehydrogenase
MGLQITQLMASFGFKVYLKSRNETSLQLGLIKIAERLQKNKISQGQMEQAASRVIGCTAFNEVPKNIEFIIEAIIEDAREKKCLFNEVEKNFLAETIICSNTSSLSISKLASGLAEPGRFVGLHFFNPVHIIKLVEIIEGSHTSPKTVEKARIFAQNLDKTPIIMQDSPGFLVNRMLIPVINEATYMLEEKIAKKEEIDLSMKLGAKHPMGPLELADLIGVDVCLSILNSLYEQSKNPKYLPSPLLKEMVRTNRLGRKTKKGFYEYT